MYLGVLLISFDHWISAILDFMGNPDVVLAGITLAS